MAESTSSTSSSPSSSTTSTTSPKSKQYIKASADDNALEPDALRGSEHLIAEAGVQDDEQDRRDAINPKKAS